MTYKQLAAAFMREHDIDGTWTPFNRLEAIAILLFAGWLEEHPEKANPDTGPGLAEGEK